MSMWATQQFDVEHSRHRQIKRVNQLAVKLCPCLCIGGGVSNANKAIAKM
jgi:hypothetical protein